MTPDSEAERKRFSAAQAALALQGFMAHRLGDGTFIVSRWAHSRDFESLSALEHFIALLERRDHAAD